MIVGPDGLEPRDDVWLGVSLLGPNVQYPDHSHAPEEIYLVISPGDFRQGRKEWVHVAKGETYYNPHNIVHAMRSTERPLLAFWALKE
jgi:quercetin dioxygenase-like cupin family protein